MSHRTNYKLWSLVIFGLKFGITFWTVVFSASIMKLSHFHKHFFSSLWCWLSRRELHLPLITNSVTRFRSYILVLLSLNEMRMFSMDWVLLGSPCLFNWISTAPSPEQVFPEFLIAIEVQDSSDILYFVFIADRKFLFLCL